MEGATSSLSKILSSELVKPLSHASEEHTIDPLPKRFVLPSLTCSRCFESYENATDLRKHFQKAHGSSTSTSIKKDSEEEEVEEIEDDDNDYDIGFDEGIDEEESIDDDDFKDVDERVTFGSAYGVFKPYVVFYLQEANWICSCHSSLIDTKALNEFGVDEPGRPLKVSINDLIQPGELWLTMLYRGGFFAGIITEMSPPTDVIKGKIRIEDEYPKIYLHKRFARYTTRRSQGGSQSAHDSSSGKANSIGAQLRRHNERALVTDIHSLLQGPEWSKTAPRCRRIFISAAKTTIADLFDGSVLKRGDPRIKNVPFSSGRPSIDEAFRVTKEIAKMKWLEEFNESAILHKRDQSAIKRSNSNFKLKENITDSIISDGKVSLDSHLPATLSKTHSDALPNLIVENEGAPIEVASEVVARQQPRKKKKKSRNSTNSRAPPDNTLKDDDDDVLEAAMAAAALESEERKARQEMDDIHNILLSKLNGGIHQISLLCRVPQTVLSFSLGLSSRERTSTSLLIEAKEKVDSISSLLLSGMNPSEVFSALGWSSLSAASLTQESGFPVDWESMTKPDVHERLQKGVQLQQLPDEAESILVNRSRSVESAPREVISPSISRVSPADDLVIPSVSEKEQKRLLMLRSAERRAHVASGSP